MKGQRRQREGDRLASCLQRAKMTRNRAAGSSNTAGMTAMTTHTRMYSLPSPVCVLWLHRTDLAPKLSHLFICVCLGDIWRLVICSQFHICLLFAAQASSRVNKIRLSVSACRPLAVCSEAPAIFPIQDGLPSSSAHHAISPFCGIEAKYRSGTVLRTGHAGLYVFPENICAANLIMTFNVTL